MSKTEAGIAAFIKARLDEEAAVPFGEGVAAWLTYLNGDGQMRYTTVAHADDPAEGPWIADGHELPEPSSVNVFYDHARALRAIAATRKLVAEITAMRHEYIEGDSWFSCSQAVSDFGDGEPGSGCSNDQRAGKPCDCGRDARVARLLGIVAERWSDHPAYAECAV